MLRMIALAAVVAVVAFPAESFAQKRTRPNMGAPATQQDPDKTACNGDSHRFCKAVLGTDDMTVLSCLQTNRQKLSKGCRAVLEKNGV